MRNPRITIFVALLPAWFSLGPAYGTATDEPVLRRTTPPAQSSPIEVVDAAGRMVRLDRAPSRILVVGHGPHIIAHLLYMFPEGRARLAGMEKKGRTASDFLPLIDPEFSRKTFLSPNPNPEQIAAVRPDLILTRGKTADSRTAAMEKIRIPIVHLGLETPDEYERDLDVLGIILGNPGRSREVAAYFKDRAGRIAAGTSKLADGERPRVLLAMSTLREDKAAVRVPALSWMQTTQVRLAGGRPVWAEAAAATSGWTSVNMEQVARWDPDRIFLVVWHTLDPQKMIDAVKADPIWQRLKAVGKGAIYAFPADLYGWDTPDPRWILGLVWLAKMIHPDLFKDIDLTSEVVRFYGDLYSMSRRNVETMILPRVRPAVD